jgi:hypothetical protein
MKAKSDYVRRQPPTERHECGWPPCDRQVPLAMWGCREHWYRLPRDLRTRIWAAYTPGQERLGQEPSQQYLEAAQEAQAWIAGQIDQGA